MTSHLLLLEDHELLAAGVRHAISSLSFEVSHARTVNEARDMVSLTEFQLGVFDLQLPDGDGIEFCAELRKNGVKMPTVLVSGMLNGLEVQRACDLGIEGIVSKVDPVESISMAVHAVSGGSIYRSKSVSEFIDSLHDNDFLTPRSVEVMRELMKGLSNKEIAADLGITEATVSFHLNQLKKKLGARTNRQLLAKASKLGLVQLVS